MSPEQCPRCGAPLRAPDLMSSAWRCPTHGQVLPLRRWPTATTEVLRKVASTSRVPLWAPLPMPPGWTVTGLETVENDKGGVRGLTLALTGPSPLGGPADLLLVVEEPGVGLAARHAGVAELDLLPLLSTAPDAKVETNGHPTALWRVPGPDDRASFAGEAGGVWFVAVLWPPPAELLLLEHVELHDLRSELHAGVELPVGAASPRLG